MAEKGDVNGLRRLIPAEEIQRLKRFAKGMYISPADRRLASLADKEGILRWLEMTAEQRERWFVRGEKLMEYRANIKK